MDTHDFSEHTSRQFNEELQGLRSDVMEMGHLVQSQIEAAVMALIEGNADLGQQVANQDVQVNALEVAIDADCARILALRAPAAVDLRLILAVIKMINNLERMGDQAERIGLLAVRMAGQECPATLHREVRELGRMVLTMVREALDAFARGDEQAAARTKKADQAIDEKFESISRQSVTFILEDPRTITQVLSVLWVVRALERIGDHAKNICEQVVYMGAGQNVAHGDIDAGAAAASSRAT